MIKIIILEENFMPFGPKTKNDGANFMENEELQIVEAMYQAEEFSDPILEDDSIFFEPEE